MSVRGLPLLLAAVVVAAAASIFLEPGLVAGGGLAVLACSLVLRDRFAPISSQSRLAPNSLSEGLWLVTWLALGLDPARALVMQDNAYLNSVLSVVWAAALAAVACVVYVQKRRDSLLGVPWVGRLLILAAGIALIGQLVSPIRPIDGLLAPMGNLISTAATSITIIVLYKAVARPGRALSIAVQAFAIGTALSILTLVAGGSLSATRFGVEQVVHPNTIAGVCGAGALLLLGTWRQLGKWWLLPVLGLMLFALFASFSKTGLLSFSVAIILWVVLTSPSERMWRSFLLGLFALVLMLFGGDRLVDYLAGYWENPSGAPTLSGRTPLWESSVRIWLERPLLGYGYRLFPEVISERAPEIRWNVTSIAHAHNSLLTVLLEMGIAGGLLLVTWLTACAAALLRLWRKGRLDPGLVSLTLLYAFLISRSMTEGGLAFRGDLPLLLLISLSLEATFLLPRSSRGWGRVLLAPDPSGVPLVGPSSGATEHNPG